MILNVIFGIHLNSQEPSECRGAKSVSANSILGYELHLSNLFQLGCSLYKGQCNHILLLPSGLDARYNALEITPQIS
jgi:hypothetical protein